MKKLIITTLFLLTISLNSYATDLSSLYGSPGATVELDNLGTVAINTDLISDTDSTDDLGSAAKEWKDLYIDGTANIDSLVADTADINAGTFDGVVGGTTPAAGSFTTLGATGGAIFNEDSTDVDFRVESDTNANALFVQGSDGRVGIGTATPSFILEMKGDSAISWPATSGTTQTGGIARLEGADVAMIDFGSNGGNGLWIQSGRSDNLASQFSLTLNKNGGDIGIGLAPTARNNTSLQILDGIGFPATQVASSDANTLDDYEEGTWTPTLALVTPGNSSHSIQLGRYQKIGNRVFFHGNIGFVKGTGTGVLSLSGLPFTSENLSNLYSAVATAIFAIGNTDETFCAVKSPNSTSILFTMQPESTAGHGDVTDTDLGATIYLRVSGQYNI